MSGVFKGGPTGGGGSGEVVVAPSLPGCTLGTIMCTLSSGEGCLEGFGQFSEQWSELETVVVVAAELRDVDVELLDAGFLEEFCQ